MPESGKVKLSGTRDSGGDPMSEIRVNCYAGHRPDERPTRFTVRSTEFEVQELDGQWYSPGATYFRVLADDGNYYVLRHDEVQDTWTLDGFRAPRRDPASNTSE
jgi:hypothetical protein